MKAKNLDEYLTKYGPLLATRAEAGLNPLHMPGRDPLPDFTGYGVLPFTGQGHAVAAAVKVLDWYKSVVLSCEMGTGKTKMANWIADLAAIISGHGQAGGTGYRVLVMCPGQLVHKWKREILETIPGARVTMLSSCFMLNRMYKKRHEKPQGAEWVIVGRDRVKLGAEWRGATLAWRHLSKKRPGRVCPGCYQVQKDSNDNFLPADYYSKNQRVCKNVVKRWRWRDTPAGRTLVEVDEVCGERLWQHFGPQKGGVKRFEPARYIHRRMKGYFDFFICDEVHEEKSATSAQGEASGCLMAACKKNILLTGTLIGGQANHVRAILLRASPRSFLDEGLNWYNPGAFDKRYGRIERITTETAGEGVSGKHSRGKSRNVVERVRPGVSPALFGRHLLGNTVYLDLEQLSDQLPKLREFVHPVDMDDDQAREYRRLDRVLRQANAELLQRGNRALLGALLQTLLCWPDYPFAWEEVGWWEGPPNCKDKSKKRFNPVIQPVTLSGKLRPKERKLIDIVTTEVNQGRQCWVYVQNTDRHDVQSRLIEVLQGAGLDVGGLRAGVAPEKREEWIARVGGKREVVVSHPDLVKTGLDLFDKKGGYNFCSLLWYETGYNTFTLRQASRRAWRIAQRKECRTHYLFYAGTIQEAAMQLMGIKLAASLAIEGKFTSEGLIALGGDDVNMEMALARALDGMIPGEAAAAWRAISEAGGADLSDPASALAGDDLDVADDLLFELDQLDALLGEDADGDELGGLLSDLDEQMGGDDE